MAEHAVMCPPVTPPVPVPGPHLSAGPRREVRARTTRVSTARGDVGPGRRAMFGPPGGVRARDGEETSPRTRT